MRGTGGGNTVTKCDEHSRLVIEPLALPSLEHTGLRTALANTKVDTADIKEEHPLFYPNGRKRKNFRAEVQQAFRKANTDDFVQTSDPINGGNTDQALLSLECKRAATKNKRKQGYIMQRGLNRSNRDSSNDKALAIRRNHAITAKPIRTSDARVRELLSSIRRDKQKIDSLCLH